MRLGESPIWDAAHRALYWVDIPGKAVHRLFTVTGNHRSWPMPSEPGCIAFYADGGLLVALRFGLARLDTDTGMLTPIADAPYDPARFRFNDGRCDLAGRLWVGTIYEPRDRPGATLYSLEQGTIRDHNLPATVSNGVAFSPDGRTMYRSDTTSHTIFAYDFDTASGQVGAGRVLRAFSTDRTKDYGGRPDGAAVDCEGAYWCAMMEGGRVLRLSPEGEILREISLPARCPTMLAFGGPQLRTLYITTARQNRSESELVQFPLSGCVLTLEVDVGGMPETTYLP